MNIETYRKYMNEETLMGPNSARVLEELLNRHPLSLSDTDIVLDLGCGKGLTSFILSKETEAKVYASDLWITAGDNKKRFEEWGIGNQAIPFCGDANELHFEKKLFRAMVSVDSYQYFGTKSGFFAEKILPVLKDKATVLIGIPGVKTSYSGRSEELLTEWLGDEAYMFRSTTDWKDIIGNSERIESVDIWEMDCFDAAWKDWFDTGNTYAMGDKQFFETHIKPYTCLIGICIKIK